MLRYYGSPRQQQKKWLSLHVNPVDTDILLHVFVYQTFVAGKSDCGDYSLHNSVFCLNLTTQGPATEDETNIVVELKKSGDLLFNRV